MGTYHRQSKQDLRGKRIRRAVIAAAVGIVALTAAMVYFRQRVRQEFGSAGSDNIASAQVTVGSIRAIVSGSGTLSSEGIQDVKLPAGVTVDEILVSEGDAVVEGQPLAVVNTGSALTALKELQDALDTLDDKLEDASADTASTTVGAGVSGRVKAIFVGAGDDVAATMAEHGALIILSLDGYMAVDLPAGKYQPGDSVTLTASDGASFEGVVSEVSEDTATVLLTDNGPLYGDTVTAGDDRGQLYIHEPLMVTGYAGTVRTCHVSENAKVSRGTALLTLKDTAYSANYDQLLADRAEMEQTYRTLAKLYQDGVVRAPSDGTVASIAEQDEAQQENEWTMLAIDPDQSVCVTISVDEGDIQSLAVGQEADVTIDSVGEDIFTGTVTKIDRTASSSGGVTHYSATVTLDKAAGMLSGMTANVSVTIQGVDEALLVPEDAVRRTSATAYVYTSLDEQSGTLGGMVEVTTGLSNGVYIEITGGLSQGDTVYYSKRDQAFSFGGFSGMGGGSFAAGDQNGFTAVMPAGDAASGQGGNRKRSGFTPAG